MTTPRKRGSFKTMAGEAETSLRGLLVEQPKSWLAGARERMRDLPKANFELGQKFAAQGKLFDAVFRFQVVGMLRPDYPQLQYNLGCSYLRMGKLPQAKAALLKALKQAPENTATVFMLASIDPQALPENQRPKRMPAEMVTGFFTSLAAGYDITEANNKYRGGNVVFDLVKPLVKAPAPSVLDLGCGSGIAARPWRAESSTIRGVDITPAMLALAEKATHVEKKLYDTLTTADISDLPASVTDTAADVILCVNTAPYIGDLSGVMQSIAKALAPEGVCVITTEPHGKSGFGVERNTSRFGHSAEYVKQTAAAAGFSLIKEASVALYASIPARAFVFGKGTS